jgi:hypothetical protein
VDEKIEDKIDWLWMIRLKIRIDDKNIIVCGWCFRNSVPSQAIDDDIYCVWKLLWLMRRWMISLIVCGWWDQWEYLLYVEIIVIDDKMNDMIDCMWELLWLMKIFIVCGWWDCMWKLLWLMML